MPPSWNGSGAEVVVGASGVDSGAAGAGAWSAGFEAVAGGGGGVAVASGCWVGAGCCGAGCCADPGRLNSRTNAMVMATVGVQPQILLPTRVGTGSPDAFGQRTILSGMGEPMCATVSGNHSNREKRNSAVSNSSPDTGQSALLVRFSRQRIRRNRPRMRRVSGRARASRRSSRRMSYRLACRIAGGE